MSKNADSPIRVELNPVNPISHIEPQSLLFRFQTDLCFVYSDIDASSAEPSEDTISGRRTCEPMPCDEAGKIEGEEIGIINGTVYQNIRM